MSIVAVTKNCTAQNTFTDWTLIPSPTFNLSLVYTSTAVATATVQRRFGTTGATLDVDTWATSVEEVGNAGIESDVYWRAGVKTGDYTAGSVSCRISQ